MRQLKNNSNSIFLTLATEQDYDLFRYAGKITAKALEMLEELVICQHTTKTLKQLDNLVEDFFRSHNCIPVFKHYRGFPATCCISVNKELVHGIPTDYQLREGDVVSFDTGCNYQGAITDSALTCIYGQPKETWHTKLISTTKNSLYQGIKSIKLNKQIGVIGQAINQCSKQHGFKVIETLGGHGIQKNKVHADPFICNKAEPDQGIRFQPGMVIAIEPLLVPNFGSTKTILGVDSWTISTENISSHYEHSLLITQNNIEILTQRSNENILS